MLVEEEVHRLERHELTGPQLPGGRIEHHVLVGVGHVIECRQQERDLGLLTRLRQHGEGNVGFLVAGAQARGVDAAPQAVGNGEREVDVPAGIVEVVVMEMDRAVLLGRVPPAHFLAGPVVARHRARRQIDDDAIETIAGHVRNSDRGDVAREVPCRDHGVPDKIGKGLQPQLLHLGAVERTICQPGAV